MAEPALAAVMAAAPSAGVDFADVQGLVRFGYGKLTEAAYLLLEVADREAARAWLAAAPVADAVAREAAPDTALQVAFTAPGLEALGLATDLLAQFPDEFLVGMGAEPSRSRRLGDVGPDAPERWAWGGPGRVPHLLVALFARPGLLAGWRTEVEEGPHWDRAFRLLDCLDTHDIGETEPFGFADGVSQPRLDWAGELLPDGKDRLAYGNLLALGEVLLGYRNEYGLYTDRPLVNPSADPGAELLPPAEEVPERRDLGRNGSYLVFRQLHQDVRGFWRFVDREAGGRQAERWALAEAMVGRTQAGRPLVPPAGEAIAGVGPDPEDIALNRFTYAGDPDGLRCPFGAHIRRANPRTADLPGGDRQGLWSRLLRMLGFRRAYFREDLVASTRFHRLLRRGREYGSRVTPDEALQPGPDEPRGLHFICLVANISRQFEFVQNAWIAGAKFNGLADESDPLLGNREPLPGGRPADRFSLPRAAGPPRRIEGLPRFVTVKGGAYFFLPGLRALRYIAGVQPP